MRSSRWHSRMNGGAEGRIRRVRIAWATHERRTQTPPANHDPSADSPPADVLADDRPQFASQAVWVDGDCGPRDGDDIAVGVLVGRRPQASTPRQSRRVRGWSHCCDLLHYWGRRHACRQAGPVRANVARSQAKARSLDQRGRGHRIRRSQRRYAARHLREGEVLPLVDTFGSLCRGTTPTIARSRLAGTVKIRERALIYQGSAYLMDGRGIDSLARRASADLAAPSEIRVANSPSIPLSG